MRYKTVKGVGMRELAERVGEPATLTVDEGTFAIDVLVKDARVAYGRVHFLVESMYGEGESWVQGSRVEFKGG